MSSEIKSHRLNTPLLVVFVCLFLLGATLLRANPTTWVGVMGLWWESKPLDDLGWNFQGEIIFRKSFRRSNHIYLLETGIKLTQYIGQWRSKNMENVNKLKSKWISVISVLLLFGANGMGITTSTVHPRKERESWGILQSHITTDLPRNKKNTIHLKPNPVMSL